MSNIYFKILNRWPLQNYFFSWTSVRRDKGTLECKMVLHRRVLLTFRNCYHVQIQKIFPGWGRGVSVTYLSFPGGGWVWGIFLVNLYCKYKEIWIWGGGGSKPLTPPLDLHMVMEGDHWWPLNGGCWPFIEKSKAGGHWQSYFGRVLTFRNS